MKVYIAGPMRGHYRFNFPAFDAAKSELESGGHVVVSPADLDREAGFDETSYPDDYDWTDLQKIGFSLVDAIERDVEAIKACDAIYMLNGWDKSKGATAEKALAEWMGKLVLYQQPSNKPKSEVLYPGIDQIPFEGIVALGSIFAEGQRKYGRDSWKLGGDDIEYEEERTRHAIGHLMKWSNGDRSEPHLAKVAWFCFTQLWRESNRSKKAS